MNGDSKTKSTVLSLTMPLIQQLVRSCPKIHKFPCFTHTLNLVAKKSTGGNTRTYWYLQIEQKKKKILSFFKITIRAKENLTEIPEQLESPPHKLIQEVEKSETPLSSCCSICMSCGSQWEQHSHHLQQMWCNWAAWTMRLWLSALKFLVLSTTELSQEKKVCAFKMIAIIWMIEHKITNKNKIHTHKPSLRRAAQPKSVPFFNGSAV